MRANGITFTGLRHGEKRYAVDRLLEKIKKGGGEVVRKS